MTKEQIGSIRIGAAFGWHYDGASINRSDESATSHDVDGMLDGFSADLGPTLGHGKWMFEVFSDSKRISPSEISYDSKEQALEGLKKWLRSYALTEKPAAAKGA